MNVTLHLYDVLLWSLRTTYRPTVVSVSTSHSVGLGFASRLGHTKDHHKNGKNCLPALHACARIR